MRKVQRAIPKSTDADADVCTCPNTGVAETSLSVAKVKGENSKYLEYRCTSQSITRMGTNG